MKKNSERRYKTFTYTYVVWNKSILVDIVIYMENIVTKNLYG